jgi:hypothetical protein
VETLTVIGWGLVAASIVAGAYYCALGVSALRHLPEATEVDRVVGWTLWWFLEQDRYDDTGKQLCRRGSTVFALVWCLAIPGYYLALWR